MQNFLRWLGYTTHQHGVRAGLIEGRLDTVVLLQGLPLAVLLGLLGAIYPAWWAASLQPVDAIRKK